MSIFYFLIGLIGGIALGSFVTKRKWKVNRRRLCKTSWGMERR